MNNPVTFTHRFAGFLFVLFITACGGGEKPAPAESAAPIAETPTADPMADHGIGPVTKVELAAVDQALADKGKATFETKCVACHKVSEKLVGPPLAGVTSRRSPEWIMNLILNTEEMLKSNDLAKKLLIEYNNVPMINNQLTQDQAREVLEYLRTI